MGLRHGFDLDHLAATDAITRAVRHNAYVSKLTGFLFSLGHGLVVICLTVLVGGGFAHFKLSHHLEVFGNLVSIIFLLFFGFLNLYTLSKISEKWLQKINAKNYLLNHVIGKKFQSIYIIGIGALFAISFETFSQVTVFSLSAKVNGGCFFSLIIGLLFMLGMFVADGLNGVFIFQIICRANSNLMISRLIGFSIALFLASSLLFIICFNTHTWPRLNPPSFGGNFLANNDAMPASDKCQDNKSTNTRFAKQPPPSKIVFSCKVLACAITHAANAADIVP